MKEGPSSSAPRPEQTGLTNYSIRPELRFRLSIFVNTVLRQPSPRDQAECESYLSATLAWGLAKPWLLYY